ncbi:MAG: hypothetical protein KF858_15230 [Candidatus Sumerlaeia bacterium]|nr:hypothetical protein [Candidatus Sumerlaeia bacterium]
MTPHPADVSPTGLVATDYALHLWRRRLWIVALSAITLVLTFGGLLVFHENIFESRALVLVREQPRLSNIENDQPGIDPPAFRSMFTSDEVIEFVRNQYNDLVKAGFFGPDAPGHAEIGTPLEKLRPRFRTTSSATVDTTVFTQYSPVIELSVRGNSAGQARALMELWSNHLLERYGNLLNEEASFLIESSRRRTADLQGQLATVISARKGLEAEQLVLESRISSHLRQLTWVPRPRLDNPVDNEIIGFNMYAGPRESSLTIEQTRTEGPPGLYELRTQLDLEIARLEVQSDEDSEGARMARLELERERAKIEAKIPEIENRIREDNARTAELASQVASLAVDINRLQYAVRLNSTVGAPAEAMLRAVQSGPDIAPDDHRRYGTLRVLSRAVTPGEKVWPRRTVLSLAAAGAMFFLLLMLFSAELYLRAAVRVSASRV